MGFIVYVHIIFRSEAIVYMRVHRSYLSSLDWKETTFAPNWSDNLPLACIY